MIWKKLAKIIIILLFIVLLAVFLVGGWLFILKHPSTIVSDAKIEILYSRWTIVAWIVINWMVVVVMWVAASWAWSQSLLAGSANVLNSRAKIFWGIVLLGGMPLLGLPLFFERVTVTGSGIETRHIFTNYDYYFVDLQRVDLRIVQTTKARRENLLESFLRGFRQEKRPTVITECEY